MKFAIVEEYTRISKIYRKTNQNELKSILFLNPFGILKNAVMIMNLDCRHHINKTSACSILKGPYHI